MASHNTSKFYFEWPKHAIAGWNLPELQHFIKQYQKEFGPIYFTQIDGCQHGMKSPDGHLIQKSWLVMNNDPEFHDRCGRKCNQTHSHRPGGMIGMGSKAVSETAFYPKSMVDGIARLWKSQWQRNLQKSPKEVYKTIMAIDDNVKHERKETKGETELRKVPKEEIEKTKAMLHRLHRAAGHPNNRSLARLCQDRGLPPWVTQLALELRCQACLETKKGAQMTLPASIESRSRPWQMIGLDTFELYFPKMKVKARYLLMTCLTMRFTSVHLLWQGDDATYGTESGQKLIHAFVEAWLLHRPRPEWVLVDAQTSLAKGDFAAFCQSIGIGVTAVPGEAHWQHGGTESMVKALKNTMKKVRSEHSNLSPKLVALLASSAQNHGDRVRGYSPVQWAYGLEPGAWHLDNDPLEVNTNNGMNTAELWQLQKNRDAVEQIHRKEVAAARMTRLYNASSRPTNAYAVGDWVCIWRNPTIKARKKEFTNEPRFIGPGRIAMVEPSATPGGHAAVYWVLMGTALWRCAPEQMSQVLIQNETFYQRNLDLKENQILKKENQQRLLMNGVGLQMDRIPVHDLDHGQEKHLNIEDTEYKSMLPTGINSRSINKARRLEGLPPLTQLPREQTGRPDEWEYMETDGKLIRHHYTPRWPLFQPTSTPDCPVEERFIQPQRRTFWWDDQQNGTYEDNWKKTEKDTPAFARTWTGRSEFTVRPGGRKRKVPHYNLDDDEGTVTMASKEPKTKPEMDIYQLYDFKNEHLTEENYEIENDNEQMKEEERSDPECRRQEFFEEINAEEREEQFFLDFMFSDKVIDAEEACVIEFEVDNMQAFLLDSTAYVADKLQGPNHILSELFVNKFRNQS
ncbi:Cytoplasmic dynein 1 heavy chain 1 [Durusdinium trenchii]|uniref:Cytoplasmic dynein 1 heavy chain 1 n=1 Tax=Durusdinium trenchii TaxID=1381693 RepID=A0ABP0JC62_9DINO